MGQNSVVIFVIVSSCWSCINPPENPVLVDTKITANKIVEDSLSGKARISDYDTSKWVEIIASEFLELDLRYATENNISEERLYPCARCFVRKNVAQGINRLRDTLLAMRLKLVLLDCYRPLDIQKKLWQEFPNASYVTPPKKGSMHNRGLAIDVQLVDYQSQPLNFGTEYDHFGKKAHMDNINFPDSILDNRRLLSHLMTKAGLKGIRTEWWHYSDSRVSFPVDSFTWNCLNYQ